MPFNTKSSPGYEIAYGISIVSLTSLAFLQISIDSFFLGFCLHISECFKDLQASLREENDDSLR